MNNAEKNARAKAQANAEATTRRLSSLADLNERDKEKKKAFELVIENKAANLRTEENKTRKLIERETRRKNVFKKILDAQDKMNQLLLLKLKENENKHNANSIMNSANAINQYEKSHSDLLHDSMIVQGPQEIEDIDSNIKYFQDQIDRYSPVNSKKKSWGVLNMFKRRNPNMNNLRSTLKTKLINDGTARSVSNIRKELNTLKKTKENIKSGINYRKKEREKTSDTIDYLSTFNKKIRGATKDLKIT